MNCERFQMVANDLARDQMMEAGERANALAHVTDCGACALIWDDERSVTVGLRTLADEMNLLSASPRLEARVLAAFREQSNGLSEISPVVRPIQTGRQLPRYWVAAIAALLLIVFGIFVVRARVFSRSQPQFANGGAPAPTIPAGQKQSGNDQPQSMAIEKDSPPIPVSTPLRNDSEFRAGSNSPRSRRGRHANVKENAAALTPKDEIATGFFPLTYGGTPNLQEGGQMVRVELSRDAVARFGLPVNMDRTGERVKADVLVGSDGLAQAIRFVH